MNTKNYYRYKVSYQESGIAYSMLVDATSKEEANNSVSAEFDRSADFSINEVTRTNKPGRTIQYSN